MHSTQAELTFHFIVQGSYYDILDGSCVLIVRF